MKNSLLITTILSGISLLTPVLTITTDNLDQDPPTINLNANVAGTVTWDFDASATAPSKGSGSVATGTFAVIAGGNSAALNLTAYPDETGYIHFTLSSAGGDSEAVTSQVITVPSTETVSLDMDPISNATVWGSTTNCTVSGDLWTASVGSGNVSAYIRASGAAVTAPGTYTFVFDIDAITGTGIDNVLVVQRFMDTSPTQIDTNFNVSTGTVQTDDSGTATMTAKAGGLYTCQYDFDVTSDGVGNFDIGPTTFTSAAFRLVDPDGSETITITNARIIVR